MAYMGFKALAAKAGPGVAAAVERKKYGAKGSKELQAAGRKNPKRTNAAKKALAASVLKKRKPKEGSAAEEKAETSAQEKAEGGK